MAIRTHSHMRKGCAGGRGGRRALALRGEASATFSFSFSSLLLLFPKIPIGNSYGPTSTREANVACQIGSGRGVCTHVYPSRYLSISMSRSKPMCADACAGTPCVRGLLGYSDRARGRCEATARDGASSIGQGWGFRHRSQKAQGRCKALLPHSRCRVAARVPRPSPTARRTQRIAGAREDGPRAYGGGRGGAGLGRRHARVAVRGVARAVLGPSDCSGWEVGKGKG